jgi:hypothetical protein
MSQNILNSSISRFSRNEKKVLNTNARFMLPSAMRGKFFHNLRSKNSKNHAISLLEMQGCPQSKSKKLNLFVSKISLKAIMNFVKTKKPKLVFSIAKENDLSNQ